MKKVISLFCLSLALAASMATPAFASTCQATRSATPGLARIGRGWSHGEPGEQTNSQYSKDWLLNSGNKTYHGSHNGNSGNSGYNRGANQDTSSNLGNQIIHRYNTWGHHRNNQYLLSGSVNSSNLSYFGHDNGNSGNSGINDGVNQDGSSNGANQIID